MNDGTNGEIDENEEDYDDSSAEYEASSEPTNIPDNNATYKPVANIPITGKEKDIRVEDFIDAQVKKQTKANKDELRKEQANLKKELTRQTQDENRLRRREAKLDSAIAAERRQQIRSAAVGARIQSYSVASALGLPGYIAATLADIFLIQPGERKGIDAEKSYLRDLAAYQQEQEDISIQSKRDKQDEIANMQPKEVDLEAIKDALTPAFVPSPSRSNNPAWDTFDLSNPDKEETKPAPTSVSPSVEKPLTETEPLVEEETPKRKVSRFKGKQPKKDDNSFDFGYNLPENNPTAVTPTPVTPVTPVAPTPVTPTPIAPTTSPTPGGKPVPLQIPTNLLAGLFPTPVAPISPAPVAPTIPPTKSTTTPVTPTNPPSEEGIPPVLPPTSTSPKKKPVAPDVPSELLGKLGPAGVALASGIKVAQLTNQFIESAGENIESGIRAVGKDDKVATVKSVVHGVKTAVDPLGINPVVQVAVSGFEALLALTEEYVNYAKQNVAFSPESIMATVEGNIELLLQKMELAQKTDPLKAQFIQISTKFDLMWNEFKAEMFVKYGPTILRLLEAILKAIEFFGSIYKTTVDVVQATGGAAEVVLDILNPGLRQLLTTLGIIADNTKPAPQQGNPALAKKFEDFLNPAFAGDGFKQRFPNQIP